MPELMILEITYAADGRTARFIMTPDAIEEFLLESLLQEVSDEGFYRLEWFRPGALDQPLTTFVNLNHVAAIHSRAAHGDELVEEAF